MKGGNALNYKRIRISLLFMMIILMSMVLIFGCSKKADNDQEQNTVLTIDEAQSITLGDDYEKVIIQVSGVVLEDGTVDEVVIEPSVGDGEVTLKNIQSLKLCVQGGGTDSIYLTGNSSIKEIEAQREDGPVRIHTDEFVKVDTLTIAEGSQDVIVTGTVDDLVVEASDVLVTATKAILKNVSINGENSIVIIEEDSEVEGVILSKDSNGSKVVVNGTAKEVIVESSDSEVEITGSVDVLVVTGKCNIVITSEVKEIIFMAGAEESTITIEGDGVVNLIRTETSIATLGDGVIEEVISNNTNNVTGDITPGETTIQDDLFVDEEEEDQGDVVGTRPSTNKPITTTPSAPTPVTPNQVDKDQKDQKDKEVQKPKYTVTFNTNEGSAISSIKVDFGKAITKPEDPTRANYKFAGWYSDKELTKAWNFTQTMPAKDMTLYVKWDEIKVSAINVKGTGDATAIDIKNGILQMIAEVSPSNAGNKSVKWTVTETYGLATDKATISNTGLLTAVKNGMVKVTATAQDGSGKAGSVEITISNQVDTTAYDGAVALLPTNNEDDIYTTPSWALFVAAIEKCDLELTEVAGQAALDAEVLKIQAALEMLELTAEVDTTAYDTILAEVHALVEEDYTADSWALYEAAIAGCDLTLSAKDGQGALDAEVLAIQVALDLLEVDTTAYDEAVALVPANNDDDIYTTSSWALFAAAIDECDLTLTEAAGQAALDAEVLKIQAALELLELTAEVNTTAYDTIVAEVGALVEGDYTADSWALYEAAIAGCYLTLSAKDGQGALDAEVLAIQVALDLLEVDTIAYDALVGSLRENNDDDTYTTPSWALFVAAIEKCDLELTEVAGQAALDAEVLKIQAALELLELTAEVDTTAYDTILAEVGALVEGDYTADSWALYQVAIADCDLTLTAKDGQGALDAEVIAIQEALDLLEELTYSIKFQNLQDDYNFGTHSSDYDGPGMLIRNVILKTGTGDIINLNGELSGENPDAFILDLNDDGSTWATTLNEERDWNKFSVYPKGGLASGTYKAIVTFTADHGLILSFNVTFGVS